MHHTAVRDLSTNSLIKAMACLLELPTTMLRLLRALHLVADPLSMDVIALRVQSTAGVDLHKHRKPHRVLEAAMLSADLMILLVATPVIKARADITLNRESSKARLMI